MLTFSSCRIGTRHYTIIATNSDPTLDNNPTAHGYIDYPSGHIVLRDAHPDFVRDNLMHELLHGMLDDSGMNMLLAQDGKSEVLEHLISAIAPRLRQFLVDNPKLVNELMQCDSN